jgi:addiction module RelE/StbE family toxin
VSRIIWSPQAIRDVESIRAFIVQDSATYADFVAQRIVAAVERLEAFPQSGRIVPERQDPAIREVIVTPYRIVYRFRAGVVEIVTVFRGSREFPEFVA